MKNTINHIFILSILALFGLVSCEQSTIEEGYTISANIAGAEDGLVKMVLYDPITRTGKTLDSTQMTAGKFEMKGKIANPDQVTLSLGQQKSINFFLENSAIQIEADLQQKQEDFAPIPAKITGSTLQEAYDNFQKEVEAIRNDEKYSELNKLRAAYNEAAKNRDKELSKKLYDEISALSDLSEDMQKRINEKNFEYAKKHGESPVAPAVIGYSFGEMSFSFEELTEIMNAFKGQATETAYYKFFMDEYQSLKSTRPGAKAPDFTLKNLDNEDFSLSNIKDKYVLLDFWASWCKPCRASYPHLKKVYQKYKDKGFEVLAVSTDSDHDQWKKAIQEDQTQWKHVVDTFSRKNFPSDIGTLYAVPFLPTTFLLDKDGIILAKNLSEEELDQKLEEIFGF